MRYAKHWLLMTLGWLFFWTVARLPSRLWMRSHSAFWWAVPLLGYYAYQPEPRWRPMDPREPRCDRCGAPLTTGLMAAFCPLGSNCEFAPEDDAVREFIRELRVGQGPR